jgi:hypothetical protein
MRNPRRNSAIRYADEEHMIDLTPGTRHGILTIVAQSDETYERRVNSRDGGKHVTTNKQVVECQHCHEKRSVTRECLIAASRHHYTRCVACSYRARSFRDKPRALKHCRECEGMPWRRPKNELCWCGKEWQAEVYGPAELYRGRSNIADCVEV